MKHFRLLDLVGAVVLACAAGKRRRRDERVRRHVAALTHDPASAAMDTAWWQE